MDITVNQKVFSTEHPQSIGIVRRVTENGSAIEFQTAASDSLPLGHAITEWFPTEDQGSIMPLDK